MIARMIVQTEAPFPIIAVDTTSEDGLSDLIGLSAQEARKGKTSLLSALNSELLRIALRKTMLLETTTLSVQAGDGSLRLVTVCPYQEGEDMFLASLVTIKATETTNPPRSTTPLLTRPRALICPKWPYEVSMLSEGFQEQMNPPSTAFFTHMLPLNHGTYLNQMLYVVCQTGRPVSGVLLQRVVNLYPMLRTSDRRPTRVLVVFFELNPTLEHQLNRSPPKIYPRRKTRQEPLRTPVEVTLDLVTALRNLPLNQAADRLGISATAFKKACRKLGIVRWMYTRGMGTKSSASVQIPKSEMNHEELPPEFLDSELLPPPSPKGVPDVSDNSYMTFLSV